MATNKAGAPQPRGSTSPVTGELTQLPSNLQDNLAQSLLDLFRTISSKATGTDEELPPEAVVAIGRFQTISCALSTLSDQFVCAAPPPSPEP